MTHFTQTSFKIFYELSRDLISLAFRLESEDLCFSPFVSIENVQWCDLVSQERTHDNTPRLTALLYMSVNDALVFIRVFPSED